MYAHRHIRTLTRRRFLLRAASATLAAGTALAFGCEVPTATTPTRHVRIGWLALTSAEDNAAYTAALLGGLADLGYTEGQNLTLEQRYADGQQDLLPTLARDLLQAPVDVTVTSGTDATLAAIRTSSRLPVVFTNVGDPLGSGLVYSLSRPGGNATGLSSVSPELAGKRLELLKTAAPRISRVAVVWSAGAEQDVLEARTSAHWLGLDVEVMPAVTPDDVDTSLRAALDSRADALFAISTPVVNTFNAEIARFAIAHNLTSIAEQRDFVAAGGLMAYGASTVELCRRAATFVDKILSGASPSDLPVERADRFQLSVNLHTAELLKAVLPERLLLQAQEVLL
jgi:putative tryptophan/tyrosine transport system substrate-binding protein